MGRSEHREPEEVNIASAVGSDKASIASGVGPAKASIASGRKWLLASGPLRVSEAGTGFENRAAVLCRDGRERREGPNA